jgi:hypothetical protein
VTEKLDDASWHYEDDFPSELPREAGATHIGMFFVWMIQAGLGDDKMEMFDLTDITHLVATRSSTPSAIFTRACDEKLLDDDFNGEGAAFARSYYNKLYIEDYDGAVGEGTKTLYHVADTWDTFDRLKPFIDKRFAEWNRGDLNLSEEE